MNSTDQKRLLGDVVTPGDEAYEAAIRLLAPPCEHTKSTVSCRGRLQDVRIRTATRTRFTSGQPSAV